MWHWCEAGWLSCTLVICCIDANNHFLQWTRRRHFRHWTNPGDQADSLIVWKNWGTVKILPCDSLWKLRASVLFLRFPWGFLLQTVNAMPVHKTVQQGSFQCDNCPGNMLQTQKKTFNKIVPTQLIENSPQSKIFTHCCLLRKSGTHLLLCQTKRNSTTVEKLLRTDKVRRGLLEALLCSRDKKSFLQERIKRPKAQQSKLTNGSCSLCGLTEPWKQICFSGHNTLEACIRRWQWTAINRLDTGVFLSRSPHCTKAFAPQMWYA